MTNRYQLIIRNEENFAEKTTVSFNYARVIALAFIFFVLVFVASLYFGKYVIPFWYEPDYKVNQQQKEISAFAVKTDSLVLELQKKDQYIMNLKLMLAGGEQYNKILDTITDIEKVDFAKLNLDTISYLDINIQSEFEPPELVPEITEDGYADLVITAPISETKVIKKFDDKNPENGVVLEGGSDAAVMAALDGKVLQAGENSELGKFVVITHSNNILTIYGGIDQISKKVGSFVKAGESIAVTKGEENGNRVLKFSLWLNDNPVDPMPYIKL